MATQMKGGVRTEGITKIYDDLRVPMKRMIMAKGGQTKHAERIGMQRTSLWKALAGEKDFSVKSFFELCASLGVTVVLTPTRYLGKAQHITEADEDGD